MQRASVQKSDRWANSKNLKIAPIYDIGLPWRGCHGTETGKAP